jgi:hypothetical protein
MLRKKYRREGKYLSACCLPGEVKRRRVIPACPESKKEILEGRYLDVTLSPSINSGQALSKSDYNI